MVSKTIQLFSNSIELHGIRQPTTSLRHLTYAAWNFAHTILWSEQQFSKQDEERTLDLIYSYFEQAENKKRAFIVFCERIVITNNFITGKASRYIPMPTVWFNRQYEHGFAGTLDWYKQIQNKRIDIPQYLQHLTIIAEHYYSYIKKPSARIFKQCRRKLLELKANNLLQLFYNTIIHFNYTR